MEFKKLAEDILKSQKQAKALTSSFWPSDISIDSNTISSFKNISNYSNKESMLFPKKSGSVGFEYALQILYFIDELYLSKPVSGDYSSVNIRTNFKATPKYIDENKKVLFDVEFGEKKFTTRSYYTDYLKEDILYGIVATIHTHPKFYHQSNVFQYSFFSPQDMSSLIYSGVSMLGLIAGRDMWLACKTDMASMIPAELLAKASKIELEEGTAKVRDFIRTELKGFGIVFYFGSLGGKLAKV